MHQELPHLRWPAPRGSRGPQPARRAGRSSLDIAAQARRAAHEQRRRGGRA